MSGIFSWKKLRQARFRILWLLFAHRNRDRAFPVNRVEVDLDRINPYDVNHPPGWIDQAHASGIEAVKGLITEGRPVLPILIRDFDIDLDPDRCGRAFNEAAGLPLDYRYQRLDGFKRYMAYRELGYKRIECVLDNQAFPGGQHGMDFVEESRQQSELEYAFIQRFGRKVFKSR
jgi:hypothetical protein